MAKNLKLTIKNTQIAEAVNLGSLKNKLASKKLTEEAPPPAAPVKPQAAAAKETKTENPIKDTKEEAPRIKARSRSAFSESALAEAKQKAIEEEQTPVAPAEPENVIIEDEPSFEPLPAVTHNAPRRKTSEELRKEIFGEELEAQQKEQAAPTKASRVFAPEAEESVAPPTSEAVTPPQAPIATPPKSVARPAARPSPRPPAPSAPRDMRTYTLPTRDPSRTHAAMYPNQPQAAPYVKLGPTGKHVKDLIPPPKPPVKVATEPSPQSSPASTAASDDADAKAKFKAKPKGRPREGEEVAPQTDDSKDKKGSKVPGAKFKEFRDVKPAVKQVEHTRFDARDRQGLRDTEEDQRWRKKRVAKNRYAQEDTTIRPTELSVRIPISIKDLASEMKLKASQLIAKLFLQGLVVTLNDLLEDETTIQLLGHEFGCHLTIDTTEEERIRVTGKSIKEEVSATDPSKLTLRPPVVAFMGHVDHGKTSLIDAIRKSNRAAGEAGAITQHIGAFRCSTAVGDIAILDTPGHEAFSAMRARGADVTDIVVLVVAGDEGMRTQTIEAAQHAKSANVTIVVAINKCDKPNFNADNVYRQLADNDLLPESWGGQIITVNCSAVTGEGIPQLLEMLALQAEVLELKADPTCRARGSVLESEMHKGKGSIATVLVQNGTLKLGDALVFGQLWGRVKTMHDEFNHDLTQAGPSTPVEITGLSGLPEAGQEFIVVKNEKEAREIAEARMLGIRQVNFLQSKKVSMENLFQQASEVSKKVLNVVLRADVQGSLEALKSALMKIESQKAELNIIFAGVGEVSESDVQLAATSKAVILGFHTQIESHAEVLMKQLGVQVKLHNIIYHAVDDVKLLMAALLDKIALETDKGKAIVKATFKSSHLGIIAGCIVSEGSIHRSNAIRLRRGKDVIWKGSISSLKRVKEDVREVAKGLECGIVLNGFTDYLEEDVLEAYEVTYITQEL